MIADRDAGYIWTNAFDDARRFVTKDTGKGTFGVGTRECVEVRVAECGTMNTDANFTRTRGLDGDCGYRQWLIRCERYGCRAFDRLPQESSREDCAG